MDIELESTTRNGDDTKTSHVTGAQFVEDGNGVQARGIGHRPTKAEAKHWEDEAVLARFGKKQQLKRRFKYLSAVGLTCNIMLTWEVSIFDLQFGLIDGGPAGVIWGFVGASVGALIQALVMAEMASMIPLAGGAFNWVAVLAPPSSRRVLSYIAGWLTVIYLQCYVATVCFTTASCIQSIAILNHSDQYEPQLWHVTLIYYGILFFALFINTYLGRILPQIEAFGLIFYIMGFVGVLIPVAYLSSHRSAPDVFGTFLNLGGYKSNGVAFLVGWITSFGSFTGADGSDHIAEEVEQSVKVVPFAMWFSTIISSVLGFAILIAMMFATPDFAAATESELGFPFIDIFVSAMGAPGATALTSILVASNVLSASSVLATASRALWAFSRENGVPFSRHIVKVHPKTRLPYNSMVVTMVFSLLIGLISVGSTAAFEAFVSLVVSAYHTTVLFTACVMLHKRLTTPSNEIPWGHFHLGRFGLPINIACIAYTTVVAIFSFFPTTVPVEPESMNYSVVIYGATLLVMIISWVFHGRKIYIGPIWELDGEYNRVK